MTEQIIKKDCKTGEYNDIFPITTLSAIKDLSTGETLDNILEKYNHLYLPFLNNSKTNTRLQVPNKLRRKGLWITYETCNSRVVTEWYNSNDFSNKAWGNSENWVPYIDKELMRGTLKTLLSWYKA